MRRLCGHSGHVGTPYIYYATHLKSIMKTTLRLTLVGLSCLAMFIAKAAAATVDPPLSDLTSYFTAVSATPATTFEANRWYAVHNPYRGGYIKAGEDCTLSCAGTAVVDGDAVTLGADRLFRFVPTADGASTYYLQTGYGHYAKRLVNGVWTTYGNEVRPRRPTMPTSAFSPSDKSMTVRAMPSRVTS